MINEPTHILGSSSSCIDLVFTSQPNLVIESGVHSSLHPNCHHQIVFAKFNLQIFYPPPYTREVWHYKDANIDLIRRALQEFNWEKAFLNTCVNKKVSIFNEVILNTVRNFIPYESITCDDRDPPWFNSKIKSLIEEKNSFFRNYRKANNNTRLLCKLKYMQDRLNNAINNSKEKYFLRMTEKLSKVNKSSKAYWSLLKTFLNNKKIPVIPPLFHENKFVTNFKEKAELFNTFFAAQCSLIKNDSALPSVLQFKTDKKLSSLNFTSDDITKLILSLDPNKAHGYDKISIRMLKICGKTISKPLELIFKQCIETGLFPSDWKKGNIVPIHKKVTNSVSKTIVLFHFYRYVAKYLKS